MEIIKMQMCYIMGYKQADGEIELWDKFNSIEEMYPTVDAWAKELIRSGELDGLQGVERTNKVHAFMVKKLEQEYSA